MFNPEQACRIGVDYPGPLVDLQPMFKGRYFANIIESPSESDRADGRSEGKVLTAALDLIGLPYHYSNVANYKEFSGRRIS